VESPPGLGCRAERQRSEVGLIGCAAVKAGMRSAAVVQRDEATPIGPRSARFSILGIRGQDALFEFMR
jgi:hypothetical protein